MSQYHQSAKMEIKAVHKTTQQQGKRQKSSGANHISTKKYKRRNQSNMQQPIYDTFERNKHRKI